MKPNEISYSQLYLLVDRARFHLYSEYKKETMDKDKVFIYKKFIEAFSIGRYDDIFVIWKGGLEQMEGRNLISAVKELVG